MIRIFGFMGICLILGLGWWIALMAIASYAPGTALSYFFPHVWMLVLFAIGAFGLHLYISITSLTLSMLAQRRILTFAAVIIVFLSVSIYVIKATNNSMADSPVGSLMFFSLFAPAAFFLLVGSIQVQYQHLRVEKYDTFVASIVAAMALILVMILSVPRQKGF